MPAPLKRSAHALSRARITKWLCAYTLGCLIVFLLAHTFILAHLQILFPTFVTIGIFLYFSLRLKFQIQGNIFGEIGFLYLAYAVGYTVFPAYGFVAQDSLRSWVGVPILETLLPDQGELGLHLWRHVLFIAAVASGYLIFRGRHLPRFSSFDGLGNAEKPIIVTLLFSIIGSIFVLWWLAAPVHEYVDYYTRYDHLPWIGIRLVAICTVIKTGGTFVLLPILFRNYNRYRLYLWPFVLLRTVQEVVGSFGARIDAFMILIAAAVLYHYCVKQITLRKALLVMLTLVLVFSVIALVRLEGLNSSVLSGSAFDGGALPIGELAAVFVPGFHLYTERSMGSLPPVPWQLFFNDFISIVPLAGDSKWNPMYWWTDNYLPGAAVPPMTMGPIALSALWGGELGLFVEGLMNGILFAFLMRWFSRDGVKWRVMVAYVFCYSTCIMCLKYSIFWHLNPLVRTILPVVLAVSFLSKYFPKSSSLARVASVAQLAR